MSDSLKDKAGNALFWNFIDKGGQQIIQLIFWYVFMQLLDPDSFGEIGVLAIFTVVATILQESGFFSALVRKKDVDEKDYSSVFYFNITVSIVIYIILFLCAPLISIFFDKPQLTNLSRFVFISFFLSALGVVQNVHLAREMNFKTNAKITFIAGLISGIISLIFAFNGFGAWSLAIQLVLQNFIRTILLWVYVRWTPREKFSFHRIKLMFSYSVNLLLNSLFNQISSKIYNIIIGKYFSIAEVGYYEQGSKPNSISQGTIGTSIQGVAFPMLSKLDSAERIKRIFRKMLRISSFISFPIAMLIIISAQPLVLSFLPEKWEPIILYMQIFAIGWAFYPPFCLISSLLQALGKSALILRIELTRSVMFILAIFITFRFGVEGLIWGYSVVNIMIFVIGFYFSGHHISYKLKEVFSDFMPYLFLSILVFCPLYLLNNLQISSVIIFFMQVILGTGIYLLVVKLLGSQVLADCIDFIRKKQKTEV